MGSKCPRKKKIACGVAFARTHVLPASENNLILPQIKLNILFEYFYMAFHNLQNSGISETLDFKIFRGSMPRIH